VFFLPNIKHQTGYSRYFKGLKEFLSSQPTVANKIEVVAREDPNVTGNFEGMFSASTWRSDTSVIRVKSVELIIIISPLATPQSRSSRLVKFCIPSGTLVKARPRRKASEWLFWNRFKRFWARNRFGMNEGMITRV
jgi:hypothetical protein